MAQLVHCIEVDPASIAAKLADAMHGVESAMLVAMRHGRKDLRAQYAWKELPRPYLSRLDSAIFMCCEGNKSIKKQIKKLDLKYLTVRYDIAISHFASGRDSVSCFLQSYLSFVTSGWYGAMYMDALHGFLTYGSWLKRVDNTRAVCFRHASIPRSHHPCAPRAASCISLSAFAFPLMVDFYKRD